MNRKDNKVSNKVSTLESNLPGIILGTLLVASTATAVYATVGSSNMVTEHNYNKEFSYIPDSSLEERVSSDDKSVSLISSNTRSCNIPSGYDIVNKDISFSNGLNSNITYGIKDNTLSENVCVEMPINDFKTMCYDHLLNYDSKDCGKILADLSSNVNEKQAYQRLIDRIN